MNHARQIGLAFYGLALMASLLGAFLLLSAFLIAADWGVGVHWAMVLYLLLSGLGTLGLLVATATFWSDRPIVGKISLVSNIVALLFSSLLAVGLLFDRQLDHSPMLVGVSRSVSVTISLAAWILIPVFTNAVGTCAALLRVRNLEKPR